MLQKAQVLDWTQTINNCAYYVQRNKIQAFKMPAENTNHEKYQKTFKNNQIEFAELKNIKTKTETKKINRKV